MAEAITWEERQRRARSGLDLVRFLVGQWEGEGTSNGEPLRGRLVVRAILGDSFLEARETLFDASGQVDHEDLALYHYDVDEEHASVEYFMAPGWVARHHVEPLGSGPGCAWTSGPFSPRVELRPDEAGFSSSVWLPGEPVPSTVMRYRRA